MTKANIKSAFAATGIHPYRRGRVLDILSASNPLTTTPTVRHAGRLSLPLVNKDL